MIKKLRKRLMLLFLSFTMLIFTAAMCLMIRNTVRRVQSYEIEYVENTADSIIELARQTEDISRLDLSKYSDCLKGFVYITNGINIQSNCQDPDSSFNMINSQMHSGKNIFSMEGIAQDTEATGSTSRIVSIIHDSNKKRFMGWTVPFS